MACLTESRGSSLRPGRSVTVEVPATSANLGPGFDCFGLAFDWRERIRLDVIPSGYQVEVTGEGAAAVPRDETHLILRSALVGLADLEVTAPGLRLVCHNVIPHGRGLGSSSAAIVAGLLAAQRLAGRDPDESWLVRHADAIEGHPDNVAAAISGGFVLAYDAPAGLRVIRSPVAPGLALELFVPETPVATSATRHLLPRQVSHADAAANAGRAALFVHAMATGEHDLLVDATRDWLHQDYRQRAMPASYELMTSLRGSGYAAVISGAGPSVLVLGHEDGLAPIRGLAVPGFRRVPAQLGPGAREVARAAATEPAERRRMPSGT